MKRLIVIVLLSIGILSLREQPESRVVFGIKLSMQGNGDLLSIYGYLFDGRSYTHKRNFKKDEFIKYASGFWPSVFNPKKENLFQLNDISTCGVYVNDTILATVPYCFSIDSLWKIRWPSYPDGRGREAGWATGGFGPSKKQRQFLFENYGVANIDLDFFIDTNFWKILRDVQNPDWILTYRSL